MAIVAIWTLFRPSRKMAIVGSVELWREAQEALSDAARHRARRVTRTWLLLLAGSVACVAAMTRPTISASVRNRRVALVMLPSAELGRGDGVRAMQDAARRFLGRLGSRDAVRLVLPAESGMKFEGDLTVKQAGEALSAIEKRLPLPIPVAELAPVKVGKDVQHVYTFAPAGAPLVAGPTSGIVEIPHALPAAAIDAVGAEETSRGRVQIFLALRNRSDTLWAGTLRCRGLSVPEASGGSGAANELVKVLWEWNAGQYRHVSIGSSRRMEVVLDVPSAEVLVIDAVADAVEAVTMGTAPDASAYLVRRPAGRTKVAMTGKVDEMLARFVRADDTLELADADDPEVKIVIANGVDPPGDKAAIVIDPPTPPTGWRRGEPVAADLTDAVVSPDDPVMRNVLLDGIHVARMRPWLSGAGGSPLQEKVVEYKDGSIVLRQPETATGIPPRVYLAFSVAPENTAFGMTNACVYFLANSVRYLAPGATGKATFEYISPVQAGPGPDDRTLLAPARDRSAVRLSRYPWPGAYRFNDGKIHAVNIVGLQPAEVAVPPEAAVVGLALPAPRCEKVGLELWPQLLAAAAVFWLLGWWARLR